MKHTPEPWVYEADRDNYGDVDMHKIAGSIMADGYHIARVWDDLPVSGRNNARRIVACVNALAGIPTHFLEESASDAMSLEVARANARSLKVKLFKAERQRDQLLAAAKALAAVDFGSRGWCAEAESAAVRLRNAIAAVEGGNQS